MINGQNCNYIQCHNSPENVNSPPSKMLIYFVADLRNTTSGARTHIHRLSAAAGGSPAQISCPFLDGGTGTAKKTNKQTLINHIFTFKYRAHTLSE